MSENGTTDATDRAKRPARDEHDRFYDGYVDAVPDGDVVETLVRSGRELEALLRSVPPEREDHRYADGKWSVREVAGHVVDSERVMAYRAVHIARKDPAALPDMDQDVWVEGAGADERPLPELVDELRAVRAASVALLRGLPPGAWNRRGVASGREVSVRALAWIVAGHALHHGRILRERYGVGAEADADGDPRPSLRIPRRRDRGKEDAWVRAYLAAAPYGFLAVPGDDGWPHLNSNLFVYDDEERCIYLHTARTGRLRELLEGERRVSFSAAAMGRMLPADEALEFSVEYSGVVVTGVGRLVDDEAEATRALQALLDRYAPHLEAGRDYRPPVPEELARTAVYRVDVESWSGKEKAEEPDFPGAFDVPEPGIPFQRPE